MKTKIICVAMLIFAALSKTQAQDLLTGAIGIFGNPSNKTIRIKTVNQGAKNASPVRVRIELYTNDDTVSMIGKLYFTHPIILPYTARVYDARLSDFNFRIGYGVANVRKVVVFTDYDNAISETNELNNKTSQPFY